MSIDCNAFCNDELKIINKLIGNNVNNENDEKIQNANIDYNSCITACNLRKDDAKRNSVGGKRKKYNGKTKNFRSRTRTNYRKKTVRRRRR
jgi:hypothetical protein